MRFRLLLMALMAVVALPLHASAVPGAAEPMASEETSSDNLLTGETVNLVRDVGGWRGDNAAVDVGSTGALAVTTRKAGWSLALSGPAGLSGTPATPGAVYTGGFVVRAATTSRAVVPYLYFYARDGRVLAKVKGAVAEESSTLWRSVTPVVGIAPAGATSVALVSLTWDTAAGEVHYLRRPVLSVDTPAGRDVVGPLKVAGNQLRDAHGPLVLRGMHRFGLESASSGGDHPVTSYEMSQAKRWGANVIRLSVASPYWLPASCRYDSSYAGAVDKAVALITARGMVALLDLHYTSISPCGKVGPQAMADASALSFWSSAAERYKSKPLVAFDLFNEPHDISDDVWLDGGLVRTPTGAFRAVGMQAMYDAVRGTGAKNVVVVSGNNWANTAPARRVVGEGIVYGVHAYTCPSQVGGADCRSNPLDVTQILAAWDDLGQQVPVVVTEFGWPSAADGRFVSNVIAYAERRGWGWIGFAWDGTADGRFSLLATAGAGATFEPTPLGMPVLSGLSRT